MPLTCELGWHSPDPLARWNHGYYFSKCTRCGRDLVRTAYSGWKVPKGVRVVWQAEPPPGWQLPDLVPSASAGEAAPDADAAPAAALQEPEPVAAPAPQPEEMEAEAVAVPAPQPEEIDTERAGGAEAAPEHVEPEHVHDPHAAPGGSEREAVAEPGPVSEERNSENAPEPAPRPEDEPELPIMAVLRDLSGRRPEANTEGGETPIEQEQAETVADAAPLDEEEPEPVAEAAPLHEEEEEPELAFAELPPPPKRSIVDDFMEEEPASAPWLSQPRPAPAPPRAPAFNQPEPSVRSIAAEAFDSSAEERSAPDAEERRAPHADERSAPEAVDAGEFDPLPEFRGPAPAHETEETQAPAETSQTRQPARTGPAWWLAGAGAAAAAVLVLLPSFQGRDHRSPAPEEARANPQLIESPPADPPPSPPPPAPSAETAYVAAPILHCRTAPAEEAPSARKLSRGTQVKVLGREPEWLSVSHEGRQCWAAARYISPDQPL